MTRTEATTQQSLKGRNAKQNVAFKREKYFLIEVVSVEVISSFQPKLV